MKRIAFTCSVMMLGISFTWGQTTGIMPKRAMKISSQRLVEKRAESPVEMIPDTTVVYGSPDEVAEMVKPVEPLVFDEAAVSMIGFDKRMSDTQESFLLRNNTSYHLSRVVVKMIYRSPENEMIDYRERVVECDLLPHSTRRCEIPSFDTSKSYYHVDSPPTRTSGRPFKVSFQLLRYDVVVEP